MRQSEFDGVFHKSNKVAKTKCIPLERSSDSFGSASRILHLINLSQRYRGSKESRACRHEPRFPGDASLCGAKHSPCWAALNGGIRGAPAWCDALFLGVLGWAALNGKIKGGLQHCCKNVTFHRFSDTQNRNINCHGGPVRFKGR